MKLSWPVEIAGTGAHAPARVLTNDDLSGMVDTSDEWIVQRTGIRERRWAGAGESTLTLATQAGKLALADAQMTPEDIDQIIVATVTPELPLPATACMLQAQLGCRWVPAFDFAAACAGFVWAFPVAAQAIVTGMAKNVLVVGAEVLSRIVDTTDRSTLVLFGDAAGAVVLRRSTDTQRSILAARSGADGSRAEIICVPAGGSRTPVTPEVLANKMNVMKMHGREVYKFAVTQMAGIIAETCADAGVTVDDLKLVVPHQSNLRIIESAAERVGLPMERVFVNIDRYGNTSAASVPVALHEARQQKRIEPGDLVMLVAFGAGLTWGSVLLRT